MQLGALVVKPQNTWWEVWPTTHVTEHYIVCGLEYAGCWLNGPRNGRWAPALHAVCRHRA